MNFEKLIKDMKELLKVFNAQLIKLIIEKKDTIFEISILEKENQELIYLNLPKIFRDKDRETIFYSSVIGKVSRIFALEGHKYQEGETILEITHPLILEEALNIAMPEAGKILKIFVNENDVVDFGKPLFLYRKI